MHTILLFAAYLSATTVAIPVVELFDTFEGDSALLDGQGIIQNPAQDFSGPGYVGSPPPSLSGDGTTTNYLQAQVPSQDIFSSGAGCPSEELFCCQGGSGPPGTLMSDAEFQGKCIAYSDKNAQDDDKCQFVSNGSCCQSEIGAGAVKVWQCVTTPIKVVPKSGDDPESSQGSSPQGSSPQGSSPQGSSPHTRPQPLLNNGKGNWGSQ